MAVFAPARRHRRLGPRGCTAAMALAADGAVSPDAPRRGRLLTGCATAGPGGPLTGAACRGPVPAALQRAAYRRAVDFAGVALAVHRKGDARAVDTPFGNGDRAAAIAQHAM